MECIFLGTPDFAAPSLMALIESDKHTVKAVFTQPDKKVGRKQVLTAPPIKLLAKKHGIPVYQPEKIKESQWLDVIRKLSPELIVTAAFGQILSQELLDIPTKGTINVHGSLLPAYRGPAPIQWAVINGETTTGVTTMFTDAGIDTGDILLKRETEIAENETAGELFNRLADIGAELLIETLDELGNITPEKQEESKASYFPMLNKEISKIDFNKTAIEVHNQVRGLNPWPIACFYRGETKINILETKVVNEVGQPGEVLTWDRKQGIVIGCKSGGIRILKLQPAGKKPMDAANFVNGYHVEPGEML